MKRILKNICIYITTDEQGYYQVRRTTNMEKRLTESPNVFFWFPVPNLVRAHLVAKFMMDNPKFFTWLTWPSFYQGDPQAHIKIVSTLNSDLRPLTKLIA